MHTLSEQREFKKWFTDRAQTRIGIINLFVREVLRMPVKQKNQIIEQLRRYTL